MTSNKPKRGRPRKLPMRRDKTITGEERRGRPRKVAVRSDKTITGEVRRGRPPNRRMTRGRPRKVTVVEGKEALPEVTAAEKAEKEAKERSNRRINRSIKQQVTETLNQEKQSIPIESTESAHVQTVNDNVSSALEESSDLDINHSTVEEGPVENNPSDYKEFGLDMEWDKVAQEDENRCSENEEHEGVETESRIELELDTEPEDEGDEIEHDIQSLPMQRASSRSSNNDSVVSHDDIVTNESDESEIEDNCSEKLYCNVCLKPCTIESFLSHIHEMHSSGIKSECFSTFKTPVLLPKYRFLLPTELHETINDAETINWDSYCNECNINYNTRGDFERHLINYHKGTRDTASNLGRDNPHLHCITCDQHLTDRDSIIQHLTYSHPTLNGEKTTSNDNSESNINNSTRTSNSILEPLAGTLNPSLYCYICDKQCKNRNAYRIHFLRVHQMRLYPVNRKRILHPDIIPDINHPDRYCAACERYFLNFKTFSCHINFIHNVSAINNSVLPSLNDPAFYCAACDKRCKTFSSYCNHLQNIHRYTISHLKSNSHSHQTHCTLCMEMFPDWKSCSKHVQISHNLKLASHVSLEDFKCYSCQAIYLSLREASNHSTHVHGLRPKIKSEFKPTLSPTTVLESSSSIQPTIAGAKRTRMKRQIECTLCGKKVSGKYGLGIHREQEHY
ncbi:hypothetical protein BD770DRAFT_409098 [Pilaira anomala]|nr:hypothetical protein BD770DRAFT_409098 [Pilaira anomala]